MTFHRPVWAAWLDDGTIDWFWAACERQGIPLMILVPGMTQKVAPIAERHPGLRVVMDHMARNSSRKDDACFADLDDLLALARFPNVSVKTTAVPCYTTEPYPFRNMHQVFLRDLDELNHNLKEVLELCLEEQPHEDLPHFVGLQQIEITR